MVMGNNKMKSCVDAEICLRTVFSLYYDVYYDGSIEICYSICYNIELWRCTVECLEI